MNPTHNPMSSKDFAIGLFLVALITFFGWVLFNPDRAGAQPNLEAEKMAQQRLATIPTLCHKIQDTNLEIDGLPEDGTAPVPGSVVTLTWTQAGNRSEPLAKHIDGSGLCSFDIAFYTHPDNTALRPHPESFLLAHSEENPVTVVDEGTVGKIVLWQTYQLTFTIPDYDVECVGGTQIDIYKDVVGSDGTWWGIGVGPIENFDTDNDGEVDRTYRDENRLVRASNWENVNYPCDPPTTTTTPDDSTTTTEAPTTTTEPETTTTTEPESTTTTVNDTTSTTVPTSSTVVDPSSTASSTVNVCTSDPSLNNVGRDSNGRFCRLSALPHTGGNTGNLLVLAGSLLTVGGALYLAFRRHRFVW